jgi:hypothetical protein
MLEPLIQRCPVCGWEIWETLQLVEHAPISCGRLFPTLEAAVQAGECRLEVALCTSCGHIWNAAYRDRSTTAYDQDYYSSKITSLQAREYQEELAVQLDESVHLTGKTVVEIGCGDGFFLTSLASHGAKVVGFEPSSTFDIAQSQPGVEVIHETFDFDATQVFSADVDLVVMRHVLEHLAWPDRALRSLRTNSFGCPGPEFLFLEVPNVLQLLEDSLYFDFYNDHIHYFSYASLSKLLRSAGWMPYAQFGTSDEFLRLVCVNATFSSTKGREPNAHEGPQETESIVPAARIFREDFNRWKGRLVEAMEPYLGKDKHVAVWGAGSRGVALLSGVGLPGDSYDYVVDSDPHKHGKYLPMINQPIHSPDQLRRDPVDCVLVTSYTYFDEILAQLDWFLSDGGRVVKVYPIPEVV